jgi:hypothetical protein
MATKYYAVTFTKSLWVEVGDDAPKDFYSLPDEERERIIEQAREEINCGDFPIEMSDLSDVSQVIM